MAPFEQNLLMFNYYAKRFSAKEAYAKAAGTGISSGVSFQSMEILNNVQGAPYFHRHPLASNNIKSYLSLSDDFPYAISYVILTQHS